MLAVKNMTESEYTEIIKKKNNAEYLAKLNESYEQLKTGKTISFSFEELKEMESDDWQPTDKILDFMEKPKNK